MAVRIVDPASQELVHLASVDVKFSGAHLGGGIYFSANHNPTPGGAADAVPQSSLIGQAERHLTTELDYTLPADSATWGAYREDTDRDGVPDNVLAGFDMSLHVGARLSSGEFYAGPSAPLLIANDPDDLFGMVTVTGYPNATVSLDKQNGTLHESTGWLSPGAHIEQWVGEDQGGYFHITGAEILGGMSGGATFLEFDVDGDGATETYLIGSIARASSFRLPGQEPFFSASATSFSPHYADLAAAIEGLEGDAARTADDFGRMVLMSAQTPGSALTTVQGQFFHEDIYGGVNDDLLLGGGGDDRLFGGAGNDTLDGGEGSNTLTGGAGADRFTGVGVNGGVDLITDFNPDEGDVIDLGTSFATLDEVVAASREESDGSVVITLPEAAGSGRIHLPGMTLENLRGIHLDVVCFTAGTLIATPAGPRPVEELKPGDPVLTLDGQARPLRAIRDRRLGHEELRDRPNLWPVVIAAGALGPGVPQRDLAVSPQHRVMVDSAISQRMLGCPSLVAARRLLVLPGVTQPRPEGGTRYLHLVFDRHEVLSANGCWSESFYPGRQAMAALPPALAREYRMIFRDEAARSPRLPIVEGPKARQMLARHAKNARPLQQPA